MSRRSVWYATVPRLRGHCYHWCDCHEYGADWKSPGVLERHWACAAAHRGRWRRARNVAINVALFVVFAALWAAFNWALATWLF